MAGGSLSQVEPEFDPQAQQWGPALTLDEKVPEPVSSFLAAAHIGQESVLAAN